MVKRWSQEDADYLWEYRGRFGRPWDYLAIELNRSIVAVMSKYYRMMKKHDVYVVVMSDYFRGLETKRQSQAQEDGNDG